MQLKKNFASLMVDEGGALADEVMAALSRPYLGPWMATSRIRQPYPSRVLVNSRKEAGSNSDSFGPNSPLSQTNSPTPRNSSPGLSPDSNDW